MDCRSGPGREEIKRFLASNKAEVPLPLSAPISRMITSFAMRDRDPLPETDCLPLGGRAKVKFKVKSS